MTKNILVIEEDFEAGREIAKALEGEGYFVFTASEAHVGMMMAKRVKPALVILDPATKGAEGIDFAKELRSIEGIRTVPILLFTEGDREYEPGYGHIYGIVNFLKKPMDVFEITAKSRALLEGIPVMQEGRPPIKLNEKLNEKAGEKGLLEESALLSETPVITEPPPEKIHGGAPDSVIKPDSMIKEEAEEVLYPLPQPVITKPHKGEKKPIGRKNIFLFVFLFLLGAIGYFGYFFFFVPGQKEELALREAPTVPEAASRLEALSPEAPKDEAPPEENALSATDVPPEIAPEIAPEKKETQSPREKEKETHFYALQLGVFGTKENAQRLAARLESRGYDPYIKESSKGSKTLYRVLVGRFDSPGRSGPTFLKLEKDGFNPIRYSE